MVEREQITIRLPKELKEQLQREADKRGNSFNEVVVRLLEKQIKTIQQNQ